MLPPRRGAGVAVVRPAAALDAVRSVIAAAFPGEPLESQPAGLSWHVVPAETTRSAFPALGPIVVSLLDGEAVACAVQIASFNETLSASQGLGAELQGRLINVAEPREASDRFVLSSELTLPTPPITEVVTRLSGWRMPSPRSSLLTLSCYLTTGRIDGFTVRRESGAGAERAAASLLVREAGGVFTSDGPTVVAASNSTLLDELQSRHRTR
jgi:fructose-1,6-bisphosphatase/inositol monophosphatase family enzyme